jgi:RNA polymerase sporulation-specific sigma factor
MNEKKDILCNDHVIRCLIYEVKNSNQTAFSTLSRNYKPLIESMVKKYTTMDMTIEDIEDLRQEIIIVFYNSILSFDLAQTEVGFGLYAKICISNRMTSRIRREKRKAVLDIISFDNTDLEEYSDNEQDITRNVIEQENAKILCQLIESNLSKFENKVWSLHVSGKSSAEIAAALSKEEKSISNAIYRIRKKLKSLLS